jgi:hypothetical protein
MIVTLINSGKYDINNNDYHLLLFTVIMTLHNAGLRGGDIFSPHNYRRCGHLHWDLRRRVVTITLGPIKTDQRVSGGKAIIVDFPGISAYKLLYRWFKKYNLWSRPSAFLFPTRLRSAKGRPTSFIFEQPASKVWLDRAIPQLIIALGLNPADFTAHSFRAGCATDLFLMNVSLPTVKLFARWKSDTALIYYRDSVGMAHIVATAFGNLSRRGHYKIK